MKKFNAPMLHIGGPAPASVKELRGAINDILRTPLSYKVDNPTKVQALQTLSAGSSVVVEGTTISNCNFSNGASK